MILVQTVINYVCIPDFLYIKKLAKKKDDKKDRKLPRMQRVSGFRPQNNSVQWNFFLFLNQNICFGYSIEPSQ